MPPATPETTRLLPPVLVWLARLLPFVGLLLGPLLIPSAHHWAWSSISGAMLGAALTCVIWKDLNAPPFSTIVGAAGAICFFIALLIAAFFIWEATLGTYITVTLLFLGMLWALTKA
jgi:hypothetical protein